MKGKANRLSGIMWALTQLALSGGTLHGYLHKAIQQTLACFLDFLSEVGPKAMKTMMEAIAGAPTCRFPPIAGCATLCTNRLQFY